MRLIIRNLIMWTGIPSNEKRVHLSDGDSKNEMEGMNISRGLMGDGLVVWHIDWQQECVAFFFLIDFFILLLSSMYFWLDILICKLIRSLVPIDRDYNCSIINGMWRDIPCRLIVEKNRYAANWIICRIPICLLSNHCDIDCCLTNG